MKKTAIMVMLSVDNVRNEANGMSLPEEPMMLLSVINTKLRDFYPSLEALCEDMELDSAELQNKLQTIDYVYDAVLNRFV
jgi:hypothetical protein